MDTKQGLFSTLKNDLMKSMLPASSGSPISTLLRRRKKDHVPPLDLLFVERYPSRPPVEAMSPLKEGPEETECSFSGSSSSDLRLLLGVLGAPLAPLRVSITDPFPHLAIKDIPVETSSAQYILQQYIAASGGLKLQDSVYNAYAMGKMKPDMWYVELSLGGSKVHAGCNGRLVWRHTPWLGPHSAKGPPRPLRRALQGLDPRTTASMFINSRCVGEKKINGEDCFILKICSDPSTLKSRSEGSAEIIRHVLLGHFSQKTGLLIHLEDSHLTRIQNNGGDAVYWETTINSFLDDYRPVEGIMIAHSGRSHVTLFKFGETAMSHTKTRMEEAWIIEEVAFNVPGLSMDCFIPPAELRFASVTETCEE
ncbi:unnamed protein product [Vicia faba]|uniref:Lipase n=1 Tax=Vicia faba TaxID=3906 RepID=A0AAV0ZQW0_VICFA|nr:unnamed protein product [Vicia faba]